MSIRFWMQFNLLSKLIWIETCLKTWSPSRLRDQTVCHLFFFQSFWSVVGGDNSMVILNCLNNFHIPSKLNRPFVTLIIKVKSLERIFEYRPISFCNVLYKLVSKVVANRLKKVLPLIVFENQSAFQAGKVITKNILIAYETLHYMKNH